MYKNKKKNKNKIIVSCIIVLLVISCFFYSLKLDRKMSMLEKYLKDISVVIENIIMYPFVSLNIDKNKDMSDTYLIQKNVNSSLEKEIEELKDALELNKTFTEYKTVNATVLSRNKSYWFNTITIDKGKRDGIKEDMAVLSTGGLIGKTTKVSNNSCEVKLITSDDLNYKVSVSISTGGGDTYAILNGYDKKSNTITVTGVSKDINVKEGDVVLTSGLGSLFPRGIYIGRVKKIESDRYNISKTLYVETSQDFSNIHYVTILKENK